jgi:hypothetical protein
MKFMIPPPEEPEAVELVDSEVVCDFYDVAYSSSDSGIVN